MKRLVPALAALGLAAAPASAASFFDGFEDETTGSTLLNYDGFANWTVTFGTVDLVRSGEFGITCRTGNYCVDLDGSTLQAGRMQLKSPLALSAGDFVDLVSWISGNQRGGASDRFLVQVNFSTSVDLSDVQFLFPTGYTAPASFTGLVAISTPGLVAPGDAFGTFGVRFRTLTAATFTVRFVHWANPTALSGQGDNIGAILDDVSVRIVPAGVIPEPATWAMLIAGFGLVGLAARRRQRAPA